MLSYGPPLLNPNLASLDDHNNVFCILRSRRHCDRQSPVSPSVCSQRVPRCSNSHRASFEPANRMYTTCAASSSTSTVLARSIYFPRTTISGNTATMCMLNIHRQAVTTKLAPTPSPQPLHHFLTLDVDRERAPASRAAPASARQAQRPGARRRSRASIRSLLRRQRTARTATCGPLRRDQ